ncbi:Mitochondrial carrier protein [Popillia japonica]|uniref:ADP/ATP translocase n=1 Tax=Popillia japonica TaxID=7064 RepID=A0AAW1JXG9_POPJA
MLEIQTFILNFVISGSAAIISKTLLAPVERAKLILQTQTSAIQIITKQRQPYSGLVDIFIRVPKEQGIRSLWRGIRSLWRGNLANVLRYFPSQAFNFAFYDVFKHIYEKPYNDITTTLSSMFSGGLAGCCSTIIVFPLHFCQTRLSVDIGDKATSKVPREFSGLNSCFLKVSRRDGIRGLYRGVLISCCGIAIYRGFYFGLFDLTKVKYRQYTVEGTPTAKPPTIVLFVLAQIVTSTSGFIAYPLDTISRYMMMESGRVESMQRCKTLYSTVKHIYRTHGVIGFYMGSLTNVLRCTASALVLVLYDEFLYYSNWKKKLKENFSD